MTVHAWNPSTPEAERGKRILSSGQPRLHQKANKEKKGRMKKLKSFLDFSHLVSNKGSKFIKGNKGERCKACHSVFRIKKLSQPSVRFF